MSTRRRTKAHTHTHTHIANTHNQTHTNHGHAHAQDVSTIITVELANKDTLTICLPVIIKYQRSTKKRRRSAAAADTGDAESDIGSTSCSGAPSSAGSVLPPAKRQKVAPRVADLVDRGNQDLMFPLSDVVFGSDLEDISGDAMWDYIGSFDESDDSVSPVTPGAKAVAAHAGGTGAADAHSTATSLSPEPCTHRANHRPFGAP